MLQGNLAVPQSSDTFNYQEYLAQHGIYSIMAYPDFQVLARNTGNPLMTFLTGLRLYAYDTSRQILSGDDSALLSGILLGLDNDMPATLVRAYQQTGTGHIIAISGFNIAIIAAIVGFLIRRVFIRWQAALLTIGGVAFYTLLCWSHPFSRARRHHGEPGHPGGTDRQTVSYIEHAALTAAIMCAFNPFLPWDISFQLSFLATLGLILFSEPLTYPVEAWLAIHVAHGKLRKGLQFLAECALADHRSPGNDPPGDGNPFPPNLAFRR